MELSTEALMRLLVRTVPDLARRSVAVPTKRLGYVDAASAGTHVTVLVDGDIDATSVLNGTGMALPDGQRVVVDFYPPHGAVVSGMLGPVGPLVQAGSAVDTTSLGGDIAIVFGTAYSVAPTVVVSPGDADVGFYVCSVVQSTLTTSGCDVRCFDAAGVAAASVLLRVNWIASGTP